MIRENGFRFGLPPAHFDDRRPVPSIAKKLFGWLLEDRGYISQDPFSQLYRRRKSVAPVQRVSQTTDHLGQIQNH